MRYLREAVAQQQKTVNPGARVRTTAGMYATVVAVDGDDVASTLQLGGHVAPGLQGDDLLRSLDGKPMEVDP